MATDPDDTDMRQAAADGRYSGFDRDGPDESGVPPPRFGRLALCLAAAGALTFGVMGTVAYGVWFNQDQQTYADAIAGARQALGASARAEVPTVAVAHAPEDADAQPVTAAAIPPAAASVMPSATQSATQTATQLASQSATAPVVQPAAPDATLAGPGASSGFEDTNPAVWSGQIHSSSPDQSPTASLADTPVDTSVDTSADTPADTSADTPVTPSAAPTPAPHSTRHGAYAAESNAQSTAAHNAREARLAQERRAASKHKGSLFARIGQFFRRVSYRQHDNGRQQQDTYSHP